MTVSSLHCCRCHSCWWAARAREIRHVALSLPVAFPNGWRCFHPLPCPHRRLLSACEYLWLIRFLLKETQLLLCLERTSLTDSILKVHYFASSLSSGKTCNYVHKRETLKSCSTQNIIFIQQNWAEKINVLHCFLRTSHNLPNHTLCFTLVQTWHVWVVIFKRRK
jgi:hypothetical protein